MCQNIRCDVFLHLRNLCVKIKQGQNGESQFRVKSRAPPVLSTVQSNMQDKKTKVGEIEIEEDDCGREVGEAAGKGATGWLWAVEKGGGVRPFSNLNASVI